MRKFICLLVIASLCLAQRQSQLLLSEQRSSTQTLGYTTIGASNDIWASTMVCQPYTSGPAGTMTKIQIVMYEPTFPNMYHVKMALYTDLTGLPNTLVANSYSGEMLITLSSPTGYLVSTMPTGTIAASTTYWICFMNDGSGRYAEDVTGLMHYYSTTGVTYATFPVATAERSSYGMYNEQISMYATYQ